VILRFVYDCAWLAVMLTIGEGVGSPRAGMMAVCALVQVLT